MGAEFQSTVLAARSVPEAEKEFAEVIKHCEYDYGHAGYTGTFAECPGLDVTNHQFSSEDDAIEWLFNNAQKWENALGVWVDGEIVVGAWCSS